MLVGANRVRRRRPRDLARLVRRAMARVARIPRAALLDASGRRACARARRDLASAFALPLAVLVALGACSCQSSAPAERGPLSLLLVTLDTTRRDFTSPYGAPAAYSPALARLAQQGATFEGASQLDATNPSHVSIMTGLRAIEHGVFNNIVPLPQGLDTLPAALQRAGFATGAFVSASHLGHLLGWRGFDVLDSTTEQKRPARDTSARARAWLRGLPADRPFFAWVHFFDPHWVYAPPEEILSQFYSGDPTVGDAPWLNVLPWSAHPEMLDFLANVRDLAYVRARYAGEVRTMDDALGELLAALEASGRADRTIVVVVADHGESLGEHRVFFQHLRLYEPQLRIPFIIRVPGFPAGIRPPGIATHIDLVPTLSELLPIALQHRALGRSLVKLLRGGADAGARDLVHEDTNNREVALRSGGMKLIVPIAAPAGDTALAPELYDLRADPGEMANLAGARPETVRTMTAALAPWLEKGRIARPKKRDIDPEEAARLRALGYLR